MKEQNETTPILDPANTSDTKKQLLIFILVAYGVTYAMGLLTWYGSAVSAELSAFPNAQMYYPAAGVMLAYMITRWRDDMLPKWFFLCFTLLTIAMLLCAVLSVFLPMQPTGLNDQSVSMWAVISQYIIIGGTILCWIPFLASGRKRRAVYGLGWKQWKTSLLCILLFLALYFGRAAIFYLAEGHIDMIVKIVQDPATWLYLLIMPINFFLAFTPFFGEEYGWRYYLQPILQKRFGVRGGVLLLGVAWGIWHVFLDFFFYTTPDRGLIMTLSQIMRTDHHLYHTGYLLRLGVHEDQQYLGSRDPALCKQ